MIYIKYTLRNKIKCSSELEMFSVEFAKNVCNCFNAKKHYSVEYGKQIEEIEFVAKHCMTSMSMLMQKQHHNYQI